MKRFLCGLLLLCAVFSLGACSPAPSEEVRIGIAAPYAINGWSAGVTYYAEKYCLENRISYKVITSSDAAEMAASLKALTDWNATAIVIFPIEEGLEDAVQEAINGGTPVVSFDKALAVEGIYEVAGDNYEMGQKSAEYIAARVDSGASIVLMDVPSFGSVSALRKQGFYDYLASVGFDTSNVTELTCDSFTRADGREQLSAFLKTGAPMDAVYSYDDEISLGCLQALEESGSTDVRVLTGGGGMQEYFRVIADKSDGYPELASALYSPIMIQDAIRTALRLSNGETVPQLQKVATVVVTRDNVSDYLDAENTVY